MFSLPATAAVTKCIDDLIFDLHWGDMGMPRTISTHWHLGGMVTPKFNGNPLFKPQWKEQIKQLRSAVGLSAGFTGSVKFHITGGIVARTDIVSA